MHQPAFPELRGLKLTAGGGFAAPPAPPSAAMPEADERAASCAASADKDWSSPRDTCSAPGLGGLAWRESRAATAGAERSSPHTTSYVRT